MSDTKPTPFVSDAMISAAASIMNGHNSPIAAYLRGATGMRDLYETHLAEVRREMDEFRDKAMPMKQVEAMLRDIISTTQLATHGQFGVNITKGIAAKYGVKI